MEPKLYEAMFVINSARGGSEFPGAVRHLAGLLERYGARIERIERWADTRLAYKIKQVERAIYVLVYFRSAPGRIAELRQAVNLSEDILRVLIVTADRMPEPKGPLFTPRGEPVAVAPAAAPAASPEPAPAAQPPGEPATKA